MSARRHPPTDLQIDARTERGIDAFCEIFGRSPGRPPHYDDCVTELDTWAASPEGQRELHRRGIKNWW
jgi:hypothetical protein